MARALENNQGKTHGGQRVGAGRKKGAATKRTREIADKAAKEGCTPLEYLLELMRRPSDHADPKIQAVRESMRFEAAKAAAPYIHPRLAAVEHTGADGKPLIPAKKATDYTDDELAAIIASSRR